MSNLIAVSFALCLATTALPASAAERHGGGGRASGAMHGGGHMGAGGGRYGGDRRYHGSGGYGGGGWQNDCPFPLSLAGICPD